MLITLPSDVGADLSLLASTPGSVSGARVAQLAQALLDVADQANGAYVRAADDGERARARQVRDALRAASAIVLAAQP